jgi:intergrase/recombinase
VVERNLGKNKDSIFSDDKRLVKIDLDAFKIYLLKKDLSSSYRLGIISRIPLIFNRSIYFLEELYNKIISSSQKINKNDKSVKLIRMLCKYLYEKQLFDDVHTNNILRVVKIESSYSVDNYVPTINEIKHTLSHLNNFQKHLYLLYLFSGVRKNEGYYIFKNFKDLKVQKYPEYVKISVNYYRKLKKCYFCYLPLNIYHFIESNLSFFSLRSLELTLNRKKLTSIKYCRKWFYTKCIEIGIPDTIADFYEGRTSNGVGNNHYLSRQVLADKFYDKITNYYIDFRKEV